MSEHDRIITNLIPLDELRAILCRYRDGASRPILLGLREDCVALITALSNTRGVEQVLGHLHASGCDGYVLFEKQGRGDSTSIRIVGQLRGRFLTAHFGVDGLF